MSPQLLQYIRALTAQDQKTLSQKALKGVEEIGELAKKVLPFENAHATTHRLVERQHILEECADLILCALSIAYDIEFSDEELEEMMTAKAQKWASLQAREAGVKYPLPFEMHVTVKDADRETFKQACHDLGVKPIVLALQDRSGNTVLDDVMTSSVFFGDNRTALVELERIEAGLKSRGLSVVRRKIETVPWHPAAPAQANGVNRMPPGGYFESHLNVVVDASQVEGAREALGAVAREHGAHLSRNAFKLLVDGGYTVMMTLRSYAGCREEFEAARDGLNQAVVALGFKVEKAITEFSLYDSASGHDASWLRAA